MMDSFSGQETLVAATLRGYRSFTLRWSNGTLLQRGYPDRPGGLPDQVPIIYRIRDHALLGAVSYEIPWRQPAMRSRCVYQERMRTTVVQWYGGSIEALKKRADQAIQNEMSASARGLRVLRDAQLVNSLEIRGCCGCQDCVRDDPEMPVPHHAAPVDGCHCGIYGWYTPWYAVSAHTGPITAVTKNTGRILMGTGGFRAERSEIVAICPSPIDACIEVEEIDHDQAYFNEWLMADPFNRASRQAKVLTRIIDGELLRAIARRYPGVAVFDDIHQMLVAFPPDLETVTNVVPDFEARPTGPHCTSSTPHKNHMTVYTDMVNLQTAHGWYLELTDDFRREVDSGRMNVRQAARTQADIYDRIDLSRYRWPYESPSSIYLYTWEPS